MARYEHIKVFQLAYIATIKTYKITANFKREYKYTLGEKMKLLCHDILDLIVATNSNKNKSELLRKLINKLESAKIYYRIAYELKQVGPGLLAEINKDFQELSRQIAGWQKWSEKINFRPASARVPET